MSIYGAKMLMWAPHLAADAESADALPKCGAPINLGALNKLTDNPSYHEVKAYGDNATKEHIRKFKECPIDVEVVELANAAAAAITGATIDTEGGEDLHFKTSDKAPWGSLAFFVNKLVDDVEYFQGIYYPKVKAGMQGRTYSTIGDSITLENSKLSFNAVACMTGDWQIKSDNLTTEEAAIAWVNEKIKDSSVVAAQQGEADAEGT